jgi:deoxyribonuclease (pyrimidine dimer)
MTRINLIPPSELSGPHLVAEYRELPRIFNLVRKRAAKGDTPSKCKIPGEYKLGPGHVTFFFDKLSFLADRQKQLIAEMKNRGYKPSFGDPNISDIDSVWCNNYRPTEQAIKINRERIAERLSVLKTD